MRKALFFVYLLVALSILSAGCANPAAAPVQPTSTIMPTPVPTLGIGSTITRAKDGMPMLYVPEGSFTMGADNNNDNGKHIVTLKSFWIDQTEMTNAKYAMCVKDGACKQPASRSAGYHSNYYGNPDFADYPVVFVNWDLAKAYCAWAGTRLPTEAEWEKAARGTDGRTYPWGETLDSTYANYEDVGNPSANSDIAKVGSYEKGKSPYGAYDMAGNVTEWVSSLYKSYPYDATDGREDSTAEGMRVARSDGWYSETFQTANITTFYRLRFYSTWNSDNVGFRCASSTAP